MTLLLRANDLAQVLAVEPVIEAVAAAFAAYSSGQTDTPLRVGVEPPGGGGVLLAMPCAVAPAALGAKIVSVFRGNPAKGLPTVTSIYVLSDYETGAPLRPGDLVFLGRTSEAYLYENPRALPRAMVLGDWRRADFEELMRTGWPDVDPGRTVLLESPPQMPAAPAAPASQPRPGSARLVRYENTEVLVDAEAPAGGFLLLTDVWHPWWRAEVDGKDTAILKADVLFRAVQLTPGRHEIRFTFHPLSGALGELAAKVREVRRCDRLEACSAPRAGRRCKSR